MKEENNVFLIWTSEGWIKSPTYTQRMCWCNERYDNVPTTHNISCAYQFTLEQVKECFASLNWHGHDGYVVELHNDIMNEHYRAIAEKKKELLEKNKKNP